MSYFLCYNKIEIKEVYRNFRKTYIEVNATTGGHYIVKPLHKKLLSIIYNILIILLSLIAVIIGSLDILGKISLETSQPLFITDTVILVVFAIDYFVRLYFSKDKKVFFKKNIFDLISIIPFNACFFMFRVTKLFRLAKFIRFIKILKFIRLIAFLERFSNKFNKFLHTNNLIYVLYFTIASVFLGATGIYITENNKTIHSFGDAVWWAFVTTTTVGYGDISPSTPIGRIIEGVLMIVGIGFLSLLTGTISTFFIDKKRKLHLIQDAEQILNLCDMSKENYNEVLLFADYIRHKDK